MTQIYFDFFLASRLPVLAGNGCHHHPGVVVRWWSPLLPARAHPLNHSAVAIWRAALSARAHPLNHFAVAVCRAALSPAHPRNHTAVAVWRAALSPGQPLRVPPAVAVAVGWCPSSIGLKRNFCFCIFVKIFFALVKITTRLKTTFLNAKFYSFRKVLIRRVIWKI
jgi:hypothetical protein